MGRGWPELGGSKRGRDTGRRPSLHPPCLLAGGDGGERTELRGGGTRGRQMPERSCSLSPAAALPGASPILAAGSRISPGLPDPAPGAAGPPAPAGSPLPRDGAAAAFSGARVKLGQCPRHFDEKEAKGNVYIILTQEGSCTFGGIASFNMKYSYRSFQTGSV